MKRFSPFVRLALAAFVLTAAVSPSPLWACACGCGVFDVGATQLMPTQPGGFAFLEYTYMDQNQNWSGSKKALDQNNGDKVIRSNFFTAGVQYMVNRSWGYMVEVPVTARHFETTDDNGMVGGFDHGAVGDVRVRGVYTGLSSDMSTGLTFGLKLPTGPFDQPDFDRDTQIGTGSTDLLLGAFHQGRVTEIPPAAWFSNIQLNEPMLTMGGYRPGSEIDASLGAYYDDWKTGGFKIVPLAQALGSLRWRDQGTAADSEGSGYQRLLLAPGLEVSRGPIRVYGDVEFPVYQYVNANQLVAAELYKLNVGYSF